MQFKHVTLDFDGSVAVLKLDHQEVMNAVTDPVLIKAFSIDDPSILQNTNFTPPVTSDQRKAWTDMWARVKAE